MSVRVDVTPNAKLFSFDTGHQLAIYKDSDANGAFLRMVTAEYGISSDTRIAMPDSVPADRLSEVLSVFLSKVDETVATNCLKSLRDVLKQNPVIQALIANTGGPRQPTPFARVIEREGQTGLLLKNTVNNVDSLVLVTDQGNAVLPCSTVASQKVGFENPEILLANPNVPAVMTDFFAERKPAVRGPRLGR